MPITRRVVSRFVPRESYRVNLTRTPVSQSLPSFRNRRPTSRTHLTEDASRTREITSPILALSRHSRSRPIAANSAASVRRRANRVAQDGFTESRRQGCARLVSNKVNKGRNGGRAISLARAARALIELQSVTTTKIYFAHPRCSAGERERFFDKKNT